MNLLNWLLHVDTQLISFIANYGALTYALLFFIVFAETGFVIFPFLPGDSLLFTTGSLCAQLSTGMNIWFSFALLSLAAFSGNMLNYTLGRIIGPHVFSRKQHWLLNQEYLQSAHDFYERHGAKMLILARFIPIIRTFAPFVAGIGNMTLSVFLWLNAISAVLWVGVILTAGYFLGQIPWISTHFSVVIYGIIAVSLLPVIIAWFKKT